MSARNGGFSKIKLLVGVIIGAIVVLVVLPAIVFFAFPVIGQFMSVIHPPTYGAGASNLKGMFSVFALMIGAMLLGPPAALGVLLWYGGGSSRRPRRGI